MILRYFCFLLILTTGLMACSNGAEQEPAETTVTEVEASSNLEVDAPAGYFAFLAETDGFGLAYPQSWAMQENFSQTRILAKSPPENETDDFQENFNVIVMPLAGTGISQLDDFIGQTETELATLISDFSLVESNRIEWAGKPAHEFVYTGTQGQYALKWKQRLVLNSKRAYIFSYTAKVDTYDQYLAPISQILNSFVVED
jgi:hypothetical protein